MPSIIFPNQRSKSFSQNNAGELFGTFWATKNIDILNSRGKIKLSERLYMLFSNTNDVDFELPVKFIRTDADGTDRYWALTQNGGLSVTDGLLFKTTNAASILAGWAQDLIVSSPTDCVDDMEVHEKNTSKDRLVVSRDTDLAILINGAWTASWWVTTLVQSAMSASNPHPLHKFNRLLITVDGNLVHTIDRNDVVSASRLILPPEFQIVWIADDGVRVFFGTRNNASGEGMVFPWNGSNDTFDEPIPVHSHVSYFGLVKDGVLHTVNGYGQLLAFNGAAFQEIDRFPIASTLFDWDDSTTRPQMIHPNGAAVHNGRIVMLVNSLANDRTLDNFPSGIWQFDPETGLHNSNTLGQFDGTTSFDWGGSAIGSVGAIYFPGNEQKFVCGAEIYTNGSSKKPSIHTTKGVSTTGQDGYFITPQLQGQYSITMFKKLWFIFKKFENSTDRIIFKYRTNREVQLDTDPEFTITWASATTFTALLSENSNLSSLAVGDELEVLNGEGAGLYAHITVIAIDGYTYTFTIDESNSNFSGTAKARFRRWTKGSTISSQAITRKFFNTIIRSTWCQFKVVIRGTETSPEIEKMIVELEDATI